MIYFDCFQGASGDMLVGALVDACDGKTDLEKELGKLGLKNLKIKITKTSRGSISGSRIEFKVEDKTHSRKFGDIKTLVEKSSLKKDIKEKVLNTYRLIFKAESTVHGKSLANINLHELGSLETLAEISSYFILTENEQVFCSRLPVGQGTVKAAHGFIPVPSPATVEILKDIPVKFSGENQEMVTPTAAALLKVSANFSFPDMVIRKTGYGIGGRSILRVFRADSPEPEQGTCNLIQVEVNIDDMSSEDVASFSEELMKVSREVYIAPVIMKKGRPGNVVTILCEEKRFTELQDKIFRFSTTSGFRYWQVGRNILPRKLIEFESSYGKCRIKEIVFQNEVKIKPEHADLVKISRKAGLSVSKLREKIIREYTDE